MDRALAIRFQRGTLAAARWLESRGICFEMAVLALVGFRRALSYGVDLGESAWLAERRARRRL